MNLSISESHPARTVSYTLDLEHDFAGISPRESYDALSNEVCVESLAQTVQDFGMKLTVFATGRLLASRPDSLEAFQALGAEVELHGYGHVMAGADPMQEMRLGLKEYRACMSKSPLGYRAPGGVIHPGLFRALREEGFRYDSSVIPSFRRGIYNNLGHPNHPHLLEEGKLVELPISVIPTVRLLLSTSYMKLLGMPLYRILFRLFGTPPRMVYLFHMVDLAPTPLRRDLSPFYRMAYGVREKTGLSVLRQSATLFQRQGYVPLYLSQLSEEIFRRGQP